MVVVAVVFVEVEALIQRDGRRVVPTPVDPGSDTFATPNPPFLAARAQYSAAAHSISSKAPAMTSLASDGSTTIKTCNKCPAAALTPGSPCRTSRAPTARV